MNIPNAISAGRILLSPLFVLLYSGGRLRQAMAVLVLAALSDILDGMIARRFDMVSDLGKALDPVGDKLMQFAMMLCAASESAGIWMLLILHTIRELILSGMGLYVIRRTGKVYGARWYGKLCTAVIYVYMAAVLVWQDIPAPIERGGLLLCGSLITMCLLLYTVRYLRILRENDKKAPRSA